LIIKQTIQNIILASGIKLYYLQVIVTEILQIIYGKIMYVKEVHHPMPPSYPFT
jgi:hypothetical protein